MPSISGLSLPLRITPRGGFSRSIGIDKIKQNLKALILTSMGERVMSPGIGTLGYMYLFRNMTFEERNLLETQIATSLERGEPNVIITEVDIFDVSDQGRLNVVVKFRIDQYDENYDISVIVEA